MTKTLDEFRDILAEIKILVLEVQQELRSRKISEQVTTSDGKNSPTKPVGSNENELKFGECNVITSATKTTLTTNAVAATVLDREVPQKTQSLVIIAQSMSNQQIKKLIARYFIIEVKNRSSLFQRPRKLLTDQILLSLENLASRIYCYDREKMYVWETGGEIISNWKKKHRQNEME